MTVHELTHDRARESEEQHRARAAARPVMLANPAALGLAGFATQGRSRNTSVAPSPRSTPQNAADEHERPGAI